MQLYKTSHIDNWFDSTAILGRHRLHFWKTNWLFLLRFLVWFWCLAESRRK